MIIIVCAKICALIQWQNIFQMNWAILFNAIDKCFPKAWFPSPQHHIYTKCIGKGFVDDTTLWETLETNTIQTVVGTAEVKAQSWECGIFVSSGNLNLFKNFWYAISWKWQKNGQPVMQMKSDEPYLKTKMTSGNNHDDLRPITCIEVTEGKWTIGLWLAPIGNNKTEYQYHIDEATKTHSDLLQAPLNHEMTRIGFKSIILSKFSWPLGMTCFSKKRLPWNPT